MATTNPSRLQVAAGKRPLSYYLDISKKTLKDHGELQLSALGQAISTIVSIAEILKKEGWAFEKRIVTSMEVFEDEGAGSSKPKMEVHLGKSAQFEQLFAAEQANAAAAAAAAGAQ